MEVGSLQRSLALSVVLHAVLVMACGILLSQRVIAPSQPNLLWIDAIPNVAKLAPKQREKRAENIKKQVVVTERGKLVDHAVRDAFLGERNQMVNEQTSGKTQAFEKNKPTENARSMARQRISEVVKNARLADLGLAILPQLKQESADDRELREKERNWAEDGQLPQDYVRGLKQSEHTALNTREYVFFSYFQRIREKLDRAWMPILRERLVKYHYSGRRLASDMDHTTRILVVLNAGGEITRVLVTGESGTKDLDDAAVRAFNEAGPFPHPPHGIVDPNGEIRIPWEFILRT